MVHRQATAKHKQRKGGNRDVHNDQDPHVTAREARTWLACQRSSFEQHHLLNGTVGVTHATALRGHGWSPPCRCGHSGTLHSASAGGAASCRAGRLAIEPWSLQASSLPLAC